jgi:isopenicillin N synthase-like dioxygenase
MAPRSGVQSIDLVRHTSANAFSTPLSMPFAVETPQYRKALSQGTEAAHRCALRILDAAALAFTLWSRQEVNSVP